MELCALSEIDESFARDARATMCPEQMAELMHGDRIVDRGPDPRDVYLIDADAGVGFTQREGVERAAPRHHDIALAAQCSDMLTHLFDRRTHDSVTFANRCAAVRQRSEQVRLVARAASIGSPQMMQVRPGRAAAVAGTTVRSTLLRRLG
jgi:hypothetical protein